MEDFLTKFKLPGFIVSAKSGINIPESFQEVAKTCIKCFGDTRKDMSQSKTVVDDIRKKKAEFQLKSGKEADNKKKCC